MLPTHRLRAPLGRLLREDIEKAALPIKLLVIWFAHDSLTYRSVVYTAG